jgi:hypothetical protein
MDASLSEGIFDNPRKFGIADRYTREVHIEYQSSPMFKIAHQRMDNAFQSVSATGLCPMAH